MTEVERLQIAFEAETKDLRKGLNDVKNQMRNTNKNVSSELNSMKKSFANTGKFIKSTLGKIFAVAALAKFGNAAINMASDLEETQNVVDVAFGEMAYKAEEFAKTAIESYGMSEVAAKKITSTHMAMAKGMRVNADAASDMAIEIGKMSADMASFFNTSTDIADTALKSIWTGETESLKKFGVVMTQVNLEQFALRNGMNSNIQAMSQAEQATLRYMYVMDSLNYVSGDFARNSNSWANQTRILSEQFKQLGSIIGGWLINALKPVVVWLNALMTKLIQVANVINAIFGKKNNTDAEASQKNLTGSILDSADAQDKLGSATEKVGKKAKGALASFDKLNILQEKDTSSETSPGSSGGINLGGSNPVIPTIDTDGINKATEVAEKFRAKWQAVKEIVVKNKVPIVSTLAAIGSGVGALGFIKALPTIKSFFSTIGVGLGLFKVWASEMGLVKGSLDLLGAAIGPTSLTIAGIVLVVMAVVGAIAQLWQTNEGFRVNVIEAWNGIKDTLNTIWVTVLEPILNSLKEMFVNIWDYGVKPLWNGWVDFVESVVMAMTDLWNTTLKPFVNWFVVTFGPVLASIFDVLTKTVAFAMSSIGQVIGTVFSNISVAVDGIIGVFKGIITFLTGVFTGDWTMAWEGVKQIFSSIVNTFKGIFQNVWNFIIGIFNAGGSIFGGIVDGITGVFRTIVNGLIGGINRVIRVPFDLVNGMLNGIRNVNILGVWPFWDMWGHNPIKVPQFPALAVGTNYVAKDGLAYIHQGEAVVPKKYNPALGSSNDKEQIALLKEQNQLLRELREKDTNVYMDEKDVTNKQERNRVKFNKALGFSY